MSWIDTTSPKTALAIAMAAPEKVEIPGWAKAAGWGLLAVAVLVTLKKVLG